MLACGYSCSAYGNYLNLVALSLYTLDVTGGPLGIGLVMALRLGSGFVAGLVAGRVVSRFDRRRLMIATDLAQALAMVALAVGPGDVALLVAAAAVLGSGNTLFTVALRSSVPELVGQAGRARANGWLVTGRSLGTVLGFGSAGVIVAAGGFTLAFTINAASFLVSAAALAVVRLSTSAARPDPATTRPRRGALVAAAGPVVALMVVLRGADAFSSASHNMALPLYATALDPARPAVVMSQFWVSWAIGSLLAHQVVRRWPGLGERAFAVGTCAMSLCFAAAFLGQAGPALMAVALLAGLADGFTEIVYTSRLQAVPDDLRPALFGRSATAETCGFATGMLASSALLELAPPAVVVGAFHGVALAGGLVLFVVLVVRRRGEVPADH